MTTKRHLYTNSIQGLQSLITEVKLPDQRSGHSAGILIIIKIIITNFHLKTKDPVIVHTLLNLALSCFS